MGYKVRTKYKNRIHDWGTGQLGKGKPFKTRRNAEKLAEFLSKVLQRKARIITVKD